MLTDAKGFYVFLYQNHRVIKRYFKPGAITSKGLTIVKKGIVAGEILITDNPSSLKAGDKVNRKPQ